MIADVLLIVGGIVALYFGAEWLVRGAAHLAAAFGVTPIVVGLTVVSLGTSTPELAAAVVASFQGSGDLAVGNVLGSNLANIGLILGVTALVRPLQVAGRVVSREVPVMLLITVALYPIIADLTIGRWEGVVLLLLLVGYLLFVFRTARDEVPEVLGEYRNFVERSSDLTRKEVWKDLGLIAAGIVALGLGGTVIVEGATSLAADLGVSELLIGITLVAMGTSLPELATSVVAALRKEADIAVGNIIGSNIFNIAAVLGAASLVRPIEVSQSALSVEFPATVLLSLLLLPIARSRYKIRRWEGAVLLLAYVGLGFWIFRV